MKSHAHTKGPWFVSDTRTGLAIVSPDGLTVGAAHVRPIAKNADADAPKANAHLMAAAPEMLKALELREQSDEAAQTATRSAGNTRTRLQRKAGSEAQRARELSRAAIAKAKGEQK